MVPIYQLFKFPLKPDPTDPTKPKHMYDNSALTNGNSYQVIGAHLNGVQFKGHLPCFPYFAENAVIFTFSLMS